MLGLRTKREKRDKRETGVCVKLLSSSHGDQSVQLALATSSSPGAHSLWPGIYSCEAPIICHLGTFYFIKIQNFFRPRLPPPFFLWSFCFLLPRLAVPEVCKWPQFRSWFLSLGIFNYFRYDFFCRIGCCYFLNDSETLDRSEFINWLYLCVCVFLKSGPLFFWVKCSVVSCMTRWWWIANFSCVDMAGKSTTAKDAIMLSRHWQVCMWNQTPISLECSTAMR